MAYRKRKKRDETTLVCTSYFQAGQGPSEKKKNMTNKKVMLFSVIYDLLWVVGVFYVEQVRQE